jgi:hypothetical protein
MAYTSLSDGKKVPQGSVQRFVGPFGAQASSGVGIDALRKQFDSLYAAASRAADASVNLPRVFAEALRPARQRIEALQDDLIRLFQEKKPDATKISKALSSLMEATVLISSRVEAHGKLGDWHTKADELAARKDALDLDVAKQAAQTGLDGVGALLQRDAVEAWLVSDQCDATVRDIQKRLGDLGKLLDRAESTQAKHAQASADHGKAEGALRKMKYGAAKAKLQQVVTNLEFDLSFAVNGAGFDAVERDVDEVAKAAAALKTGIRAAVTELDKLETDVHRIGLIFTDAGASDTFATETGKLLDALGNAKPAEIDAGVASFRQGLAALRKVGDTQRAGTFPEIEKAGVKKLLDAVGAAIQAGGGDGDLAMERTALVLRLNDLPDLPFGAKLNEDCVAMVQIRDEAQALLKRAQKKALAAKQPDEIDQAVDALPRGEKLTEEQEALCMAAIEARFGIAVEVATAFHTKKLANTYDLLRAVPRSHTNPAVNTKLKKIEFHLDPPREHNYYLPTKISLNTADEGTGTQRFAWKEGVADKTASLDSFSVTTLHEVGHSVDDKEGFMDGKTGGVGAPGPVDFGGWSRETVDSVADAWGNAGGFYAFDGVQGAKKADLKALLKARLQGSPVKKPTKSNDPLGSLKDAWDQVVAHKAYAVCDALQEGKSPWNRPEPVGGRVYHEAYGGHWYSYDEGARAATGVSSYQWRAPGEWFAECYAMHYLKEGGLPGSHPLRRDFLDAQGARESGAPI